MNYHSVNFHDTNIVTWVVHIFEAASSRASTEFFDIVKAKKCHVWFVGFQIKVCDHLYLENIIKIQNIIIII